MSAFRCSLEPIVAQTLSVSVFRYNHEPIVVQTPHEAACRVDVELNFESNARKQVLPDRNLQMVLSVSVFRSSLDLIVAQTSSVSVFRCGHEPMVAHTPDESACHGN